MWMPRASAAYKLGERTVIKAGYGMFFDTLNAADYNTLNQLGYTSATVNVREHRLRPDLAPGRSAEPASCRSSNPFPVRANGNRFEDRARRIRSAPTRFSAAPFTWENPNRKHARVQRWRVGVQREFFGNTSVEVAYSGQYADRVDRTIAGSFIPE